MNIDVRQYLRINPISVHELTLSDDDNDCFLFFPTSTRGYMALKQSDLFTELKKSILGGLLDPNGEITTSGVSEADIDEKFKNYVRRSVVHKFQDFETADEDELGFNQKLDRLESDLDEIILTLRRKGVLDYAGAVELQSNNTRKLSWTSGMGGPLYKDMPYSRGQIWCKSINSDKATTGGLDEVTIGSLPLRHNHPETMAETLTGPLSDKFGGGQLMGDFTIGSKELVAQGTKYGPSTRGKATPLEHATNEALTYPLWGQNILDWRNPKKEHNNVPPSLNIYVRYWAENQSSIRGLVESTETYEEIIKRIAEIREQQVEKTSAAEAQYDSFMASELPEYVEERLTPHDCLLRISSELGEKIKLMRQSLQMLLDIFAEKTNNGLSTEDGTMEELLMSHLDGLLMTVSEFMQWYDKSSKRLDAIEEKIEIAEQLCKSVPPLNYIGRIIISYTDDTEQKVIANYGGKSWRRIENFLRGVNIDTIPTFDPSKNYQIGDLVIYDKVVYVFIQHHSSGEWNESHVKEHDITIDIPGKKLGEEYVALRESNIPIHSHTETLPSEENEITTRDQEWMAKNKGGDAKIVNTTLASSGTITVGIENTNRNYQISPLEYMGKSENEITLPHDNLPPYMKVYIWECTELTDEERRITGEPTDDLCVITWLANGGTWSGTVSNPDNANRRLWTCKIGWNIKNYPTISDTRTAPTVGKPGYDFIGWKCPDGTIKPSTSSDSNIPAVIDDVAMGNAYYVAQWKPTKHTVTFNVNEHTATIICTETDCGHGESDTIFQRTYEHNDKIGYLPIPDEFPEPAIGFDGWYTDHRPNKGREIDELEPVNESTIYYAHWIRKTNKKVTIRFFDYNGEEIEALRKDNILEGSRIGELVNRARTGYTFKGWFTARTGGDQIFATKKVYNDLNLYEQWESAIHTITWDPNYEGGEIFTWERAHGSKLGSIPEIYREGYTFVHWTNEENDSPDKDTPVEEDITYCAQWENAEYNITYYLKGGKWPTDTTARETYSSENLPYTLPQPNYEGHGFVGWTGSNGSTPQFDAIIPVGSIGDKTYVANWSENPYTVNFNKNNTNAQGVMAPQSFAYGVEKRLSKNEFSDNATVAFNGNGGTPEVPSKPSKKEFLGWAESSTGEKKYNDQAYVKNLTTEDEITLYALWANTYNAIKLPNASRLGYKLDGWYYSASDETSEEGYNDTYTPLEPTTTLYAHWKGITVKVTLDFQGGIGGTEYVICTYDETMPSIEMLPTYTGHSFEGYYTETNGRGDQYYDELGTSERICHFLEDSTLYAKWERIPYIIRFDANGGSGRMNDVETVFGKLTWLPLNEFTRTGYTFDGWARESGGDVIYNDGDSVINLSETGVTVTLFAHWTINTHSITYYPNDSVTPRCKVTFDANGGSGGYTQWMDVESDLTAPSVEKTGHRLIGWDPAVPEKVPNAASATYTAQWEVAPKYTVTFNANGGTTTETTREIDQGHAVGTLPSASRTGYTLDGWFTSESSGTQITAATIPTGNVTYYAHWTANQYTVTFDANGGTGGTSGLMDYGSTIVAPTVTWPGHTFTGWWPAVDATVPIGGATYTAQWDINTYSVIYNPGTDGSGSQQTVAKTHDVALTLKGAIFTRTGYTQMGWSTSDGGSKAYDLSASYTANEAITLYPFWTANKHSITYYPNNPS